MNFTNRTLAIRFINCLVHSCPDFNCPGGVEEALQNKDGGHLVDDGAVFGPGASGGVQMAVGFGGGEALVPEVDRETGFIAQSLRKGLGLGGLGTLISGHVEGIANDDLGAAVFADEAHQGFEVLPSVGADEGQDRLRGESERVGYGHADTAISYIEAHESRDRARCQFVHSRMVHRGGRSQI